VSLERAGWVVARRIRSKSFDLYLFDLYLIDGVSLHEDQLFVGSKGTQSLWNITPGEKK